MFTRKISNSQSLLEFELEHAVKSLRGKAVGSEEYQKIIDQIVTMNGMLHTPASPISRDTLAVIGGNILGILLIIKHEHVNVITSKAFGLILRPR